MKAFKIVLILLFSSFAGFSFAQSDQDDDRSLYQEGADYIEESGKNTHVEPYTDATADKIRSLEDKSYDSGDYDRSGSNVESK